MCVGARFCRFYSLWLQNAQSLSFFEVKLLSIDEMRDGKAYLHGRKRFEIVSFLGVELYHTALVCCAVCVDGVCLVAGLIGNIFIDYLSNAVFLGNSVSKRLSIFLCVFRFSFLSIKGICSGFLTVDVFCNLLAGCLYLLGELWGNERILSLSDC